MEPSAHRHITTRFTNRLGAFGMTAVIGFLGIGGALQQCAPPPAPVVVQVGGVQDAVVGAVNTHRAAAGRGPLVVDSRLTSAAQSHADDMANRSVLTHVGADGSNAGQRIAVYGYGATTWGENVAAGQTTAAEVVDAWMRSSGHRATILRTDWINVGVAAAKGSNGVTYWTLVVAA